MGSGAGDMGGSGGAGIIGAPPICQRERLQWTRIPSNVQKDRLEQEQEELRGGVGV